jgi:hypothetical protein
MSLEQALETLEFKSLDDVDVTSLKSSFKRMALTEHPDRGGSQFDNVLSAYTLLSGILRRQTGGRDKASILHPDDVQQAREEQNTSEMAVLVNEVLDSVQREEQNKFIHVFNEQFIAFREKEEGKGFSASETRGHSDWLSSDEKSVVSFESDGLYGSCTMAPPVIKEEDLHHLFEYTARCGKPPVTDLALLPDQMARTISCGGMSLISLATDSFTSDLLEKPEYTDLHDAYTRENTVVDKLPTFQESMRTFEDLLKERDIVYQSEHDKDLAAISLYEKVYQQQQAEHKKQVEAYFQSTGASQWALRGIVTELDN